MEAAGPAADPVKGDASWYTTILAVTVPADLGLYPPAVQTGILAIAADLDAIVADGPGAFDDADSDTTLAHAGVLSSAIPALGCPAF